MKFGLEVRGGFNLPALTTVLFTVVCFFYTTGNAQTQDHDLISVNSVSLAETGKIPVAGPADVPPAVHPQTEEVKKNIAGKNEGNFEEWSFDAAKIQNQKRFAEPVKKKVPVDTDSENEPEKFHWKPALIQTGIMLGVQHGFRLTQDKTQKQLGGSFFGEWKQSVKNLRGWHDGDSLFVNYVAHPLQGATTGRIFVYNSDRARKQEFGKSKQYWESRAKALAWSAVWSTQFELGPASEASIGNVGRNDNTGRSGMAWGDLIVTPVVGTGLLVGEDAIDKYILKNWLERNAKSRKIRILRSFLTPTMSVTNLLRGQVPWKRDNRK